VNSSKSKAFNKTLSYACTLLSYRPRSKKELYDRLKRKKFDKPSIEQVIKYLEEINYIDDKEFARLWIKMRLSAKPCGVSLLYYELKNKGLSEDLISFSIDEALKEYDEKEAAIELAKQRKVKIKKCDKQTTKRRIFGFF